MALTLSEVRRDPVGNRALEELSRRYAVAEENASLVLTQKTGNLRLFVHELEELHQWDFVWNLKLREYLCIIDEQRENWKRRAVLAEAKLAEVSEALRNAPVSHNVSDVRYAALKRYLAKEFHPDHAPGHGIEKVVRNEIFKQIWGEIDRLNNLAVSNRAATA
jgi:hypothetical protein